MASEGGRIDFMFSPFHVPPPYPAAGSATEMGCMGLCGGVRTDRNRYSDRCQWVSNPFDRSRSRSRSLSVLMRHKGPPFADMTSVPPMECPTQMIGRSPTPAARSFRDHLRTTHA